MNIASLLLGKILPILIGVLLLSQVGVLPFSQVLPAMADSDSEDDLEMEEGDVFVAVGSSSVQWRHADGTFVALLTCTSITSFFTTGMAFNDDDLYVTMFDGRGVCIFDETGTDIGTFGSGYLGSVESIVFGDDDDTVFTGEVDVFPGCPGCLRQFDEVGNTLMTFTPALENRGIDHIELADDDCTLFYTSEGNLVKRYDVCTNTQLIDFATLHLPAVGGHGSFALRLIDDDDGLLVASTADIHRLDSTGTTVQTYDAPGQNCWFALNLDSDDDAFWAADFCTSDVYKFDISTGAVLLSFNTGTGPSTVFGLVVKAD